MGRANRETNGHRGFTGSISKQGWSGWLFSAIGVMRWRDVSLPLGLGLVGWLVGSSGLVGCLAYRQSVTSTGHTNAGSEDDVGSDDRSGVFSHQGVWLAKCVR